MVVLKLVYMVYTSPASCALAHGIENQAHGLILLNRLPLRFNPMTDTMQGTAEFARREGLATE
jgi:hypothetical protein